MKQTYLFLLILVAALTSCNSGSFKIDGNITNLESNAVTVVFHGDSGIVEQQADVDKKGHFAFKGESPQPVIVYLLNHRYEVLAVAVVANGDHIKVKGDAGKSMSFKVKGNRLNEDWQLFRDEHRAFYSDPNPSRLDAAIEKYVREHPDDMLSTVLMLVDYSDYNDLAKVNKMLKGINAKARPESLTATLMITTQLKKKKTNMPRLTTLNLVKHDGGFEEIKLADRMTLLSMWANPQNDRSTLVANLQALSDKSEGRIRIIDILTEGDTLRWHKTIQGEKWPHYWAPGGPLEQGIQLLGITSLPWYAVADSTGLILYSGPNLDTATKMVTESLHH